ncbi:MAG: DUF4190 domain-containing protein [bacterium]
MIQCQCPQCGSQYQMQDELAGRNVKCRNCEATIPIPEASEETLASDALMQSGEAQERGEPGAPPAARAPQAGGAGTTLATSGLAIAALVLGILGFCLPLLGIVALILGLIAINQIDNPANRLQGRGMAMSGVVLGSVSLVVMLIIPLLIGILLPSLGAARRTARSMQSNTQLRGIHQNMVVYAQGNKISGSHGQYPGLMPDGEIAEAQWLNSEMSTLTVPLGMTGAAPEARYTLMFDANLMSAGYVISPLETKTLWQSGPLTTDNYSYSMLGIGVPGGRRDEWQETLNADALVLGDRNTGDDTQQRVSSVLTTRNSGEWRGGIAHNDNHVSTENDHVLQTRYGGHPLNRQDNLFEAAGAHDAELIYERP